MPPWRSLYWLFNIQVTVMYRNIDLWELLTLHVEPTQHTTCTLSTLPRPYTLLPIVAAADVTCCHSGWHPQSQWSFSAFIVATVHHRRWPATSSTIPFILGLLPHVGSPSRHESGATRCDGMTRGGDAGEREVPAWGQTRGKKRRDQSDERHAAREGHDKRRRCGQEAMARQEARGKQQHDNQLDERHEMGQWQQSSSHCIYTTIKKGKGSKTRLSSQRSGTGFVILQRPSVWTQFSPVCRCEH